MTRLLPQIRTLFRKPRVKESLIGAAIGLSLGIIMGILSWIHWVAVEPISTYTNDFLFESDRKPEQVVIVALDDQSVEQLGSWPLPREAIAEGIEIISLSNPKAIAVDLVLESGDVNEPANARLVAAVSAAGNVVLGQAAYFENGIVDTYPRTSIMHGPFAELREVCEATAHLNVFEIGSRIPEIPPVIGTPEGDSYMFALQAAAIAEGIPIEQLEVEYKPGNSLSAGDWYIPLGYENGVIVNYRTGHKGFPTHSLAHILNGSVPPDVFNEKIVLIGPYLQRAKDSFSTPLGEMYGIEIQGNVVESIVDDDFIAYMPEESMFTALVLAGVFMGIALANLSILKGFFLLLVTLVITLISWGTLSNNNFIEPVTVDSSRLIFDLPYPILTLITSFVGVSGRRYYIERSRRKRISGTFERFVTPQVLKEIMKSDDAELQNPQGKLKEITVLFIDIRGYTTISEKLPADEVFDLLNRIFAIGNDIFTKYNGTINKFIGDAIMVIFNAPLPQADHALNAVMAACEMQQALESFRAESGIEISCGIGINTGMAMVGTVGSGKRMEYTCIGDTVNVASRLEGQAKEGVHIVIGPNTYNYVKDYVEASPLSEIVLKGKSEAIQLYQVISPGRH